ncbi:S41 family peptidase [Flavivirga aquimarina]|uniref:S41 family peptidase n=1 Tax=Flavivirga aquimarina TaxID=2027862 RepID=A0ABT8W5X8_9FLAO|nr:S41 family peptidase [Flavivirga aquimarina]MDO5968524.1 S41 family peptidase [Flavivirga aquimarina]
MKFKNTLAIILITATPFLFFAQNKTDYRKIIDTLINKTTRYYIFPEAAKSLKNELSNLPENGFADLSKKQFADTITSIMATKGKDKHFALLYRPNFLKNVDSKKDQQKLFDEINRRWNFGFETVKRLPGNIGYIEYTGFAEPNSSKETLAAAMNFLANTNSLILDVRNNRGGDEGMLLLLCSYFFDKKEILSKVYYRYNNKTILSKTKKKVLGKKYLNKPVYILTNKNSFSAAESISYHLQNRGIATIVGETTSGAANPVDMFVINNEFLFFVPNGNVSDIKTNTNWEHTGVKPNYQIPEIKALEKAQIVALENIIKNKIITELTTEEINQRLEDLRYKIKNYTQQSCPMKSTSQF